MKGSEIEGKEEEGREEGEREKKRERKKEKWRFSTHWVRSFCKSSQYLEGKPMPGVQKINLDLTPIPTHFDKPEVLELSSVGIRSRAKTQS